jgi:hypothetical protein
MLEVDYTSNNKVTNRPPKVTIIERRRGKDKKRRKSNASKGIIRQVKTAEIR